MNVASQPGVNHPLWATIMRDWTCRMATRRVNLAARLWGLLAAIGAAVGVAIGAAGCANPQPSAPYANKPAWAEVNPTLLDESVFTRRDAETASNVSSTALPTVALETYVQVWRFRVAAGRLSTTEQLWDHLDESIVAPRKSVLLRRNGIRVGVGRVASWPAVRAILVLHEPQVSASTPVVAGGGPWSLELADIADGTPLFYFDSEDRLTGARHAAGKLCLRMEHLLDLDNLAMLTLRAMPEIRRDDAPPRRQMRVAAKPLGNPPELFSALTFTMAVPPEHFIVIGPGPASRMPHLVGSRLFRSAQNDEDFENVYCIVPKILRRQVSTHWAAPK